MPDNIDTLYKDVLCGVGAVTTNFAKLEFHMDVAIWLLTNAKSPREGDAATKTLRFKQRCATLSDLCKAHLPEEAAAYFEDTLLPALTHANGARSKRIVHAIISKTTTPNGTTYVTAVPRKHFMTALHTKFIITPETVKKLSNEIGEACNLMWGFINQHLLPNVTAPPWWNKSGIVDQA